MGMLAGFMQRYTDIKTVGLCHSVQVCTESSEHNAEYNNLFIKSSYPDLIEAHRGWLPEYHESI